MRILLGTTEIARHLYDLGDAFRRLGHEADTVVNWANSVQNPDLAYDHALTSSPFPERLNGVRNPLVRYPRALVNRSWQQARLRRFMTAYDVYLFQFGGSLLPENRDFPLLKGRGKHIISVFNGDDIRHWSAAEPFMRRYGLEWPSAAYVAQESAAGHSLLPAKLKTLRMAELHADAIHSVRNQSQLALRPYHHFFLPMNLDLYRFERPSRVVPRIVHAPSWRGGKGTELILQALSDLKASGIPFELRLLEDLPNEKVLAELTQADVLIDQLHVPTYGMLCLEGMATGCAVAGGNDPECEPLPPGRPMLHIDPSSLHDQLRRLLQDTELRADLAARGRAFVEKHHDHVAVARRLLAGATGDTESTCDHYPSFYTRDYVLPTGVALDDDLLEMTDAVLRHWGMPADVDLSGLAARGLVGRSMERDREAPLRWGFPAE